MNKEQKKLKLQPARTLEDAEDMRVVRNTCRHFMTQATHEISYEEQRRWWKSFDRATILPFLARAEVDNQLIGYGLVRHEAARKWLTGGVLPAHRGCGYGEQLFRGLIAVAGIPCWLEVLASNLPARRLYAKLGFVEEAAVDDTGMITMSKKA